MTRAPRSRIRTFLSHAVVLSALLPACAASARFYSRTGRELPQTAVRAIRCTNDEVAVVMRAGGEPIGTIAARAISVEATDEDVDEKASIVAARNGGTHYLLTEKAVESFTVSLPGQTQQQCTQQDQRVECTTTYTEPSARSYDQPTGKFVVFRVPLENWLHLPSTLRPVLDD